MGSVVVGRKLVISVKSGTGKPNRTIMKAPLLVLGRI